MSDHARDVIAHKLHERHPVSYLDIRANPFTDADAILAALHEAGYEVVKRQVIDADALALGTITPNVDEDGLTTVYLIDNTPEETP